MIWLGRHPFVHHIVLTSCLFSHLSVLFLSACTAFVLRRLAHFIQLSSRSTVGPFRPGDSETSTGIGDFKISVLIILLLLADGQRISCPSHGGPGYVGIRS